MKRKLGSVIAVLIFLAIGAVSGLFIGEAASRLTPEGTSTAREILTFGLLLAAVYPVMALHIALHEGGHWAGGRLTGYRLVSYRWFGLMWLRGADGKLRFARYSLAGTGGQCLMDPPAANGWDFPVLLYNLGGSLANLLAAGASLALALLLRESAVAWALLMMSAVVGLGFALANGVPLRMNLVSNDGMNAVELSRSREARRAFWIEMRMNAETSRGARLRDMPAEWFELPEPGKRSDALVATLCAMATSRLMDERRFDEASELIAALLERPEGLPAIYLNLLAADRSTCLALRGDAEGAAQALDEKRLKALKGMQDQPSLLRARYALARLVRPDADAARKLRERFDAVAAKYPYAGEVEGERELMALIDDRA